MSIEILKLVNGEDIISNVEYEEDNVVLSSPAKLIMFLTEEGVDFDLIPWCLYAVKEKFVISSSHVIFTTDPPEELRNNYNKIFGSGIITVKDISL